MNIDDVDAASTNVSAIATLSRLADEGLPAQIVNTPDGRVFGIHRNDVVMSQITPENAAEVYPPKIIKLTTQLQTSLALAQYLHRFKDADSIMFADVAGNKITAIMDYHVRPTPDQPESPDGKAVTVVAAQPRHSAHRAILQLNHSQEWATWTGRNEKLMSHVEFANFLEENAIDVISPDGAALLELCRDLNVKGGVSFKSDVRMGDTVSFEYQKAEDVSTKGGLELPAVISIGIPVYFGEPEVVMNVMLRRKIDDGKLYLGFKIQRLENHKQTEFLRIATTIEADTEVESILGNPA